MKRGRCFKSIALVVMVAMTLVIAGGCGTVTKEVRGSAFQGEVVTTPRACDTGETYPCFNKEYREREIPAGSTVEKRDSWCSDHSGLCWGAVLGGAALVVLGAAAAAGQLTPEAGQGGKIQTQGMQPGGK